jgi:hypothetical protein
MGGGDHVAHPADAEDPLDAVLLGEDVATLRRVVGKVARLVRGGPIPPPSSYAKGDGFTIRQRGQYA